MKQPSNAFTLAAARHCVVATKKVGLRLATGAPCGWRGRSLPPKKTLRLCASALNKKLSHAKTNNLFFVELIKTQGAD